MLSIKQILVAGHSEMRCAKYDTATGKCYAPIRNQGVAYLQEAYSFYNGAAICQSPMTNPIHHLMEMALGVQIMHLAQTKWETLAQEKLSQ